MWERQEKGSEAIKHLLQTSAVPFHGHEGALMTLCPYAPELVSLVMIICHSEGVLITFYMCSTDNIIQA